MTATCIDILLAEDDEDLREAMVETLSDAGYTVEAVGNGRDAIEWLEDAAHLPKLILLDLMMPVMDGWQFLEKREKTPRVAAVPVVVLSASAKFDSTNDTVLFMRKPIAVKPLLAIVASYCAPGDPTP
jgi:two-component system, chemotaxis family, chemotaxis protein CheY